jgi:1-deoxy-D-xylulose-5-phosphate reductoisomerase
MKRLVVLGSTGTIGEATLDVAARHPEQFRVLALAAHGNHEALFAQCERFRPDIAVLVDRGAAAKLATRVAAGRLGTRILAGAESLDAVAASP